MPCSHEMLVAMILTRLSSAEAKQKMDAIMQMACPNLITDMEVVLFHFSCS